MKHRFILFIIVFFICISCISSPEPRPDFVEVDHICHDVVVQDVPLNLPKNTIVLSPGWLPDDVSILEPLNARFVAWGNSPAWGNGHIDFIVQKLQSIGIEKIAADTWTLSLGGNKFSDKVDIHEQVARDFEGKRFVPQWLADSPINGIPQYWGCTNNPYFRDQIFTQVKRSIEDGANVIHADDPSGSLAASLYNPGCFCDYCIAGFTEYLSMNFSIEELKAMGVSDISSFNYKAYLKSKGYRSNQAVLNARYNNSLPLNDLFFDFQLSAVRSYLAELKQNAAEYAGEPISFGTNAYNLQAKQLFNADIADYFANEIRYDGDYRSIFAYHIADAIGKPVFATAGGEAWVRVAATEDMKEMLYWFSEAYSSGHYLAYAHKVWGWSHETGTQWNIIPVETLLPYADFVNKNPDLFNGFEAVSKFTMLYNNKVVGDLQSDSLDIATILFEKNIPYKLILAGDKYFPYNLHSSDVDDLNHPLLVPDDTGLSESDALVISSVDKVEGVMSIKQYINNSEPFFLIKNNFKLLAREKNDSMVLHVLNTDFSGSIGRDIELYVSSDIFMVDDIDGVNFYAPARFPEKLDFIEVDNGFVLRIPEIDIWGVIKLDRKM